MYTTFHSGKSNETEMKSLREPKLFKYIDPKKEKFTNQLKNDTSKHAEKSKDRLARTRQYNQMVNVTDLKQRQDIDALPYTKDDFRDMLSLHLQKKLTKKDIKPKINTNINYQDEIIQKEKDE